MNTTNPSTKSNGKTSNGKTSVHIQIGKSKKSVMPKPKPRHVNHIDTLIGQKLRARRSELKMSQEELANALGVSFQQVQKYEKGVNRIASGRLIEIARHLQTTTDYFLHNADKKQTIGQSTYNDFMMTKEGPRLIEAMVNIKSIGLRRAVLTLARELANLQNNEEEEE